MSFLGPVDEDNSAFQTILEAKYKSGIFRSASREETNGKEGIYWVESNMEALASSNSNDMLQMPHNEDQFPEIRTQYTVQREFNEFQCTDSAKSNKMNLQGGISRLRTAKQAIRSLSKQFVEFETTSSFPFLKKSIWYGESGQQTYFSSNLILSGAGGKMMKDFLVRLYEIIFIAKYLRIDFN